MKNTAFPFQDLDGPETAPAAAVPDICIPRKMLQRYGKAWLLESKIRQLSAATQENRKFLLEKLLWYMEQEEIEGCDRMTVRGFLGYVSETHQEDGGSKTLRWDNKQCSKKVKPGTVATYHRVLRAMFNWIVTEARLPGSPMENVAAPVDRPDDIHPFTDEQVNALLAAARKSSHPRRDEAILCFLLDTGVRVSELCGVTLNTLDMDAYCATVDGKGGKKRQVYFGLRTTRALWKYLQEDDNERAPSDRIFQAGKGALTAEAITPSGVQQLLGRLGKVAHIQQARCSPHTFRHTMAVTFLRNGGNQFALMQILGHTNTKMTSRYVQFAQADVANQYRRSSPVDRLSRKNS